MNNELNLPTKSQLIKLAREETVSMSLRVKESTYVVFKKMADEAGVKLGTMVNTLLDYYAQNNFEHKEGVAKDVMLNYLNSDKFWGDITKESKNDLIYRFNNKGLVWPLMDNFESVAALVKAYRVKDYDDIWICPEISNDISFDIHIADEPHYEEYDDDHLLYVTAEQWPLICVMIVEYGRKYHKLFPESPVYMTEKMLKRIAKYCQEHKKADISLSMAVKNVLVDHVERMEDD